MALELTDQNFKELVLNSDKPVLVDFWAEWCGPCKAIGPMIEELATELEGKAVVAKLNVDFNPETSMTYGVMSIPMLLVIKNGQIVNKWIGGQPKGVLKAAIEAASTSDLK